MTEARFAWTEAAVDLLRVWLADRVTAAAGSAAAAIAAALDLDVATVRAVLAETGRSRRDGGAR